VIEAGLASRNGEEADDAAVAFAEHAAGSIGAFVARPAPAYELAGQ